MADSASITRILGLPVQPSDTTQLADGTVLTYDKQTRSFSFQPGGGGGGGVTSLNALTGALTIAGGTDISVSVGGSTITISFTGSSGSGTVTSVALTVPAEFTVAGSPVTTSGTLAISKANESANTVWAGPTTGGAAQPTFRALVTADMPAGTGTVTSVALTVPAEFSVAGSPVTTSGTLAVTKANQSANNVYAGPTSGGAAAPTFRTLVDADLPTQPYTIINYLGGRPDASQTLLRFKVERAVNFAGNFSGSQGTLEVNPADGTATYVVKKNGVQIGTVAITTGGAFTFATTAGAAQSFATGDEFSLIAPTTQDSAMSGVGLTFKGTR